MGTYHFMGVGRAVGAVTCAVDYIEKALDIASSGHVRISCPTLLIHKSRYEIKIILFPL